MFGISFFPFKSAHLLIDHFLKGLQAMHLTLIIFLLLEFSNSVYKKSTWKVWHLIVLLKYLDFLSYEELFFKMYLTETFNTSCSSDFLAFLCLN